MQVYKNLLLGFAFFMSAASAAETSLFRRIQLEHIEGGGVGYNTGYTTLKGFFAVEPDSDTQVPFLDVRGHIFDNGKLSFNLGSGLRNFSNQRIYGIYAFYDYRNTKHNKYNQLSLGVESLGTLLDGRMNGYLPIGKQISDPYDAQFSYFAGNNLFLFEKVEYALGGVDAEVGMHLGTHKAWNFYGAVGPYYYHNRYGTNAVGGMARIKWSYKDFLFLEVIEHYDSLFHNNTQILISVTFPSKKDSSRPRNNGIPTEELVQSVQRNEIIPVDVAEGYGLAMDPNTNSAYHFIFVDNTSHSLGTYESPYPSLAEAQANSQNNQIIYVFPGDGTTTNMNQGITLQDNQKLWGSGVSHNINTASGAVAIPQMTATAPQISNTTLNGRGVTLAKDNEISGITITQTSGEAIYGVNPNTFSLSSSTLTQNAGSGSGVTPVMIQANTPLVASFDNNTFTNNHNGGVFVELQSGATSSQITFTNNTATNNQQVSGGVGVLTIDPNGTIAACDIIVNGNKATGNSGPILSIQDILGGYAGSFTSFSGVINNNVFTNNSSEGIFFGADGNNIAMTIDSNNFSNNNKDCIYVKAGNGQIASLNMTINNNQLTGVAGVGSNGVSINAPGKQYNIVITNNNISDNNSSGILSYIGNAPYPAMNFTISNNTIQNNANAGSNAAGGISIDGFDSLNASVNSNTFSGNTGGSAIGLYGNSLPIPTGNVTVTFNNNNLSNNDTFNMQFWGNTPTMSCLSMQGNTCTTSPTAYTLGSNGTGTFNLTPSNYATLNTGSFDLTNVTISNTCP